MTKIADLASFKKKILEHCLQRQEEQISSIKDAMDGALESALSERSGSEDSQDSFREQMQHERTMYAKKLSESTEVLATLQRINPSASFQQAGQGSLVLTDKQLFLIAGSLGKISVDGNDVFVISNQSPIYDVMSGKRKGESFDFRGQKFQIMDVA